MLKIYIKSYQKTLVKPQNYFTMIIRKPLTTEGKLKSVGMLADILGKNRLRRLGLNIPVGRITAWQAVMLNKAAEELPPVSDITGADDI